MIGVTNVPFSKYAQLEKTPPEFGKVLCDPIYNNNIYEFGQYVDRDLGTRQKKPIFYANLPTMSLSYHIEDVLNYVGCTVKDESGISAVEIENGGKTYSLARTSKDGDFEKFERSFSVGIIKSGQIKFKAIDLNGNVGELAVDALNLDEGYRMESKQYNFGSSGYSNWVIADYGKRGAYTEGQPKTVEFYNNWFEQTKTVTIPGDCFAYYFRKADYGRADVDPYQFVEAMLFYKI